MNITKQRLQYELVAILKQNAPVRDGTKYPGKRGASPYPGNLKNNGIYITANGVYTGGDNAPYAVYTETRSRKKGWHKKSHNQFLALLQRKYGGVIK